MKGVPFATHEAHIVADGGIAITAAPNVARTLRLPDMAPLFDRRPPGLMRVAGAALANAGLLLDDAGWRAVVLPSLGDLASDLGQGPIAIRADGRRVSVVHEGAVYELELPGAATIQVEVDAYARCDRYAHDGTLLSRGRGGTSGPTPGTDHRSSRSPPRPPPPARSPATATARAASGTPTPAPGSQRGPPALLGPLSIALSADGEFAIWGTPFADPAAACVVRAVDGAVVRYVDGARTIALHPQGKGMLVGGEWGALYLEPPREAE